ncbi:hypothetical protein ADIWIN_2954 [Winogradskyella psychrotolerans RS-3]|uniref:Conjugative transposon protein TraN n=1 Tax=Winogradskyella psychrotolerans RS-3 TaxID=641526 RepID=S7VPD8_9FLAO|nr:hypothetical protein [Winogradskyella psychrotolerans]EPR72115.1 hypothetical protein ADIWIN_2954 [Winogradskyella psychrotolerans RS-3]
MKKPIITAVCTFLVYSSTFAQFKIQNTNLDCEKVKGIITVMEKPEYIIKPEVDNDKEFFSATTVVGIILPYAIKYGSNALKKATSKKAEDYTFESEVLNPQAIDFKKLKDSVAIIKVKNTFYKKGGKKENNMATYDFDFFIENNFLKVKLSNIEQIYTPVKIHKNYDLIMNNFDLSITAFVREDIKDSEAVQEKIIDLGTSTIHMVNPSFQLGKAKPKNEAQFFLPSLTKEGQGVTVIALIIKLKVKHVNPHGTTSNYLNEFLETNSDNNEGLLTRIFIKEAKQD